MELKTRFWDKVDIRDPGECWPWKGAQRDGYGMFFAVGQTVGAHRVAFELFYHRKPKRFILHKCDNGLCVNPHHLYEGDRVDNARDLYMRNGGRRKLSNDDVAEIRELHKTGRYLQRELAGRFGCSQQNIGLIIRDRAYTYIS